MSNNRNIKSRNKSNEKYDSKTSLIDKVNSTTRPEPEKLGSNSRGTSSNKETKSKKPTNKKTTKQVKRSSNGKNKSFFFRLSKVGQVMFCIYVVGCIALLALFGRSLIGKGNPIMNGRNEPIKIINKDDIAKVKSAIEKDVKADKVDVHLAGYRLVVVMDLPDSTTASEGKKANYTAYRTINTILPINEYFSSNAELNNDLFIYSTDVVPNDFETNSKYIFQTYKNSKMKKPKSYDLLQARDEESKQEVLDTFKKSKESK